MLVSKINRNFYLKKNFLKTKHLKTIEINNLSSNNGSSLGGAQLSIEGLYFFSNDIYPADIKIGSK